MAKQNKTILKGYFESGDIPNQSQYGELIDSQLNLEETGTQIVKGTVSSSFLEVSNDITASGNISSSGTISGLTGSFSYLTGSSPIIVAAEMIPDISLTHDLGSSAFKFRDLYNRNITSTGTIIGKQGEFQDFVSVPSESAYLLNYNVVGGDYIYKSEPFGSIGVNNEHAGTVNGHLAFYAPNSSIRMAYSMADVSGPINGVSQSFATSASISAIRFQNLPTTKAQAALIGTGSLWLSGSADDGSSKFLLVYTG
jgi:hypothetical protein